MLVHTAQISTGAMAQNSGGCRLSGCQLKNQDCLLGDTQWLDAQRMRLEGSPGVKPGTSGCACRRAFGAPSAHMGLPAAPLAGEAFAIDPGWERMEVRSETVRSYR